MSVYYFTRRSVRNSRARGSASGAWGRSSQSGCLRFEMGSLSVSIALINRVLGAGRAAFGAYGVCVYEPVLTFAAVRSRR
jgi:hypothetical protein